MQNIGKLNEEVDEPAWKIVTSNQPGKYVWRVKALKLEVVSSKDHGIFYSGDSYIVLHSFKSKSSMKHNVFLWIGTDSSQDERGVGAYKMVELDYRVLSDAAVQYREEQGCESDKFLSVFESLTICKGGYATGFNVVKKEEIPRIFHISGFKQNVRIMEVSFFIESITSDDVYIIDLCTKVYMFKGKTSNKDEKFFATQCWSSFKSKKPTAVYEIIEEAEDGRPEELFAQIPRGGEKIALKKKDMNVSKDQFVLVKVSDGSGKLEQVKVAKGNPKLAQLDTNDIFILNVKSKIFVWVGSKSSLKEQRFAIIFADEYMKAEKMAFSPVEVIKEGRESEEFLACFE